MARIKLILLIPTLLFVFKDSHAQCESWNQKSDFSSTARTGAVGFSINNKGYIGTGIDQSFIRKDFWVYDPSSDTWTQKADLGGNRRYDAVGFSINGKGYIGTGYDGNAYLDEFWEYDPSTNNWNQMGNFDGSARYEAVGFSIDSMGYIGTGYQSSVFFDDFWEYDPTTDNWVKKANFRGSPRAEAAGFSMGSKGYIGTGFDNTYNSTKDFWAYNPAADEWFQIADFSGGTRHSAVGFSIGTQGFIGLGRFGDNYEMDFWSYNPIIDSWTQRMDFDSIGRVSAVGFSINRKGYVGTGSDSIYMTKDFWEYIAPVVVSIDSITQVTCKADSIGEIFINVDGGRGPYSFDWSNGATDSNLTNLREGTYTVTVTDNYGCADTASTTISKPQIDLSTSVVHVSCDTCCDGIIDLTVNSGVSPFTYSWSNGKFTQDIANLCQGVYEVTVRDSMGCKASITDTVSLQTGVSFVPTTHRIRIYPNPVREQLNIEIPQSNREPTEIKLLNRHGQIVQQRVSLFNNYSIPTNELPSGLYILEVIINGQIHREKVLIL